MEYFLNGLTFLVIICYSRFEKLVPKRYAPTAKVPNTRGCYKCCYGRNAYNGFKYLCGALPNSIILMQWYDPLNKYMLLKVRLLLTLSVHILIGLKNDNVGVREKL